MTRFELAKVLKTFVKWTSKITKQTEEQPRKHNKTPTDTNTCSTSNGRPAFPLDFFLRLLQLQLQQKSHEILDLVRFLKEKTYKTFIAYDIVVPNVPLRDATWNN